MHSLRMKWRSVSRAASAGLLAAAALSGGCSSIDCQPYSCGNVVSLNGSIVVAKEVTVVDFRFCADNKCNEGSIDLTEGKARMPCTIADPIGSRVCLSQTSEPSSFALRAQSFQLRENEVPHDVTVQLTLVDHATGGVLLDETRTAESSIGWTDNCHVCWGAEATL